MSEEIQEAQETEVQEIVEQKEAPKPVDKNWEEARQVLNLQKQKIEELERRLVEREKPEPPKEVDEFANLDPEDYLTVGKAKSMAEKYASKTATQEAQRIVQEYMVQQNVTQDEARMRAKHEDYDYVIENFVIQQVKNDPALAYKIQQSKNPAETAYKIGKLSDGYEESNMTKAVSPKSEKILKNSSRPISANAVGTPLKAQADQFSNMTKQDIWTQSQKYAKQV